MSAHDHDDLAAMTHLSQQLTVVFDDLLAEVFRTMAALRRRAIREHATATVELLDAWHASLADRTNRARAISVQLQAGWPDTPAGG